MTHCEITTAEYALSEPATGQKRDIVQRVIRNKTGQTSLQIDSTQEVASKVSRQRIPLWEGRDADLLAEDVARFGRWSIDLLSKSIVWSRGLANLFGRGELAECPIDLKQHIACYHPSERASVRAAIKRGGGGTATGVDGFSRRSRILRPDGEVRNVVVHGRKMRDAHGDVVGIRGITLDVTPLMRSEYGIQTSETILRNTLENMDQGLIQFGPDRRVQVLNHRARVLLDLPEHVLHEGAKFEELHAILVARGDFDGISAFARADLDRKRIAGQPHSLELTRGGVVLEVRYVLLPEGGAICTYMDVSARRNAEATLRESERRLRLITENVNDVIVLGDLSMARLYVSPAVQSLLGCDAKQFMAERITDRIHPEDRYIFDEHRKRMHEQPDFSSACCTRLWPAP